MKHGTGEAFNSMFSAIKAGEYTEDELIRCIAAFSREKDNGKLDGWGLSGFVRHIDKWMPIAKGQNMVYLVCDKCSKKTVCSEIAVKDHSGCGCGGRNVRDDQSGRQREESHKKPNKSDMPTKADLEKVVERHKTSNPALAGLAQAQIDRGNFRFDLFSEGGVK